MSDDKPIADTVELVMKTSAALQDALCDHQGFFLIVLDDHSGTMPAAENLMRRPKAERERAASVLRMWAGRLESGKIPTRGGS